MKILMVGLGGAGQRHLRILRELLGDQGRFLAWRVRGRSGAIAPDFSSVRDADLGVEEFPSLEAALDRKPDAVVISNPTSDHVRVAASALRAGAHVLVEKPLSNSLEGLEELERLAAAQRRVVLVGYMMRFHPCLMQIRRWIDEGSLGKPLCVRFKVATYVPEWHPYEDYRDLYAVRKALGGGVVLTESHELDLALWFFGRPRRIFAVGGALSGRSGDVEDTASILLDYGFPVHLQLCFMQKPTGRFLEIGGTDGQITWEGGTVARLYRGSWTESAHPDHERIHLFRDQASHFLECIRKNERPRVSLSDGVASLKMALAALKSMSENVCVEMQP